MALQVRVMYRTAVLQLAGIQWRIHDSHLPRPQQTDATEAFCHINHDSYHLSRLVFVAWIPILLWIVHTKEKNSQEETSRDCL